MGEPGRLIPAYRELGAQHALGILATWQHGVISVAQLLGLGLTTSTIHRWVKAGRLYRVHRGVYSIVPPELLTGNGRFMAAVLACGAGAVLSHRSAAALHELRPTDRSGIDVTVPGRTRRIHQGIDLHRSVTLTPADVTTVEGIPCTTIARTMLDLAAVTPQRAVQRALDQAAILEKLDANALQDQLQRNAKTRAARNLRTALDGHLPGSTPTWSEFEERFLAACHDAGVPAPEVNAWITLDDGEPAIRADFVWRAHKVVIETDGRRFHGTPRAFESDRRRDQRLTMAGWRVVRVTWSQLHEEPRRIQALIAGLLAVRPA